MTTPKLFAAFVKAQSEMEAARKDAANPHFKSRYATLEAVIDAVKPALNRNGLGFVQMPGGIIDGCIEIRTAIIHESGEDMTFELHVPLGKKDAQGVGSAISYGRRYALMAVCGIPAEDDDGNAASQRAEPIRKPPSPPKLNGDQTAFYERFEAALAKASTKDEIAQLGDEYGVSTTDPVIKAMTLKRWREISQPNGERH